MNPIYPEDYDKVVKQIKGIIGEFFDRDGYKIEVSHHMGKLYITEYEDKFATGKSMMMASVFERIFVLTGFYATAFSQDQTKDHKNYLQLWMHHKDAFESVDKDGTYWENTHYRAKCPVCGATEPFDLMRYDPKDHRDTSCSKCNASFRVRDLYDLTQPKPKEEKK